MSTTRSETSVVTYLAYMGALLAFGIDAALPAFDELREAFDLEPDANSITLVVTLYFIGMAVGQLVYGPVSDRFGRSPAVLVGMGVYCLGALGSIVAPNVELLFVSRFVWGLGAAAPGVLRQAIARDLYEGDQMARVTSKMMGVFMLGPVVAPIIGEAILQVGSWRWIFVTAIALAVVQIFWTLRFGETLDPADQRPLEFGLTIKAFRIVFSNRSTVLYMLALVFGFASFIVFLGSSQPIIDNIYDRGDQFALWFALTSIVLAIAFFSADRFIQRFGTLRVAIFSSGAGAIFGSILLVIALSTDGVPSFWVWLALIGAANAFITLLTPTGYALALEPLGALAGTASAVMGFMSAAGGAVLAGIINSQITDTVTPMAVAYSAFSLIGLAAFILAGRAPAAVVPAAEVRSG